MTRNHTDVDARAVVELQELLLSTDDIDEFLHQLTVYAAEAVSGPVSCGITLRRDGRAVTVASSDELASLVDEVQYSNDEGPCLSSMRTGEVNLIEDLVADERWRAYAAGATAHGVRSSLSIPLVLRDGPIGAMNLYARTPHGFDPDEQAAAGRLAGEAARVVTLAVRMADHAELAENLKAALASRSTIDQAMGVVMGQRRCSADEAFQVLRTLSQNRNVKLRDVAAEILTAVTGRPHRDAPTAKGV